MNLTCEFKHLSEQTDPTHKVVGFLMARPTVCSAVVSVIGLYKVAALHVVGHFAVSLAAVSGPGAGQLGHV